MKIKTLFLVFFICFSSYSAAAKYGKTDPKPFLTLSIVEKFDSNVRRAAEK